MENKKKLNFRELFPYLSLTAVLVVFLIWSKGRLLSVANLKAMLHDGFYIIASGGAFCFMIAQGILDFSIGQILCLSCAIGAIVSRSVSPTAAIFASVLTGLAVGTVNGILQNTLRIRPMTQGIAMMFVLSGVVNVVMGDTVLSCPLGMRKWFSESLLIIILLFLLIGGYVVFEHTAAGRICKSIASCRENARQCGINIKMIHQISYMYMGLVAGILGFVSLIRTGTSTPLTGNGLHFDVLTSCLLGGIPIAGGATTRFRSVLIGGATVVILSSGMKIIGVSSNMQQLIKGIVFLIAIGINFDRKNMRVIK